MILGRPGPVILITTPARARVVLPAASGPSNATSYRGPGERTHPYRESPGDVHPDDPVSRPDTPHQPVRG